MAHSLEQMTNSCPICLDPLKDPVTIPCEHTYCMNCIKDHFDKEDEKMMYHCPHCRKTFTSRPVLMKNTMLADLMEQLKKTELRAASPDHRSARAEDVLCDVCTGRKRKALKSCLVCLASYCHKHLQPHRQSPPLKEHMLVEPSKNLLENICPRHDEVMKTICRADQQCVSNRGSVIHKVHDVVSAAAERPYKQMKWRQRKIERRVQNREKDLQELQKQVDAINISADKSVEDNEELHIQLVRLLEKKYSDVKQKIRSQQQREVSAVKKLQEELQQEIAELKRRDAELKQLANAEDLNQCPMNQPDLSAVSPSTPVQLQCPSSETL